MKHLLLPAVLIAFLAVSCQKESTEENNPSNTNNGQGVPSTPTEGSIELADNTGNKIKYDDKTIDAQTFKVDTSLVYISSGYGQITIQSKEKEGIYNKYNIGINMVNGIPKVGEKTSILWGTTPLMGINIWSGTSLYNYSAMNGTFTIEALDAHNITLLVSDVDMKQSFSQGFDPANKRFKIKSFRIKGKY